jgi:hypothetical protein
MTTPSAYRANRAIGAMFFSLFGGAWLVFGAVRAVGLRWGWVALLVCASLALFFSAVGQYRKHSSALAAEADTPARKKQDRLFHIINAGQWVLLFIVGNVLNNLGRGEWFFAAAIIIVGAHFLPLGRLFRYPPHYAIGAAMILWGCGYPFLAKAGAASPVGCLGEGLLLWASALYALKAEPSVEQPA